jgi:hypothetical protein
MGCHRILPIFYMLNMLQQFEINFSILNFDTIFAEKKRHGKAIDVERKKFELFA